MKWIGAVVVAAAAIGCVGVQDLGDRARPSDGGVSDSPPASVDGRDASDARDAGEIAKEADAAPEGGPTSPFAPGLIEEMIAAMRREWRSDEILAIEIIDKDWTVVVNKTSGVIDHRRVWTHVTSRQPTDAGPYCRVYEVSFLQRSLDGKTYRPTEYNSVGDSNEIPCPP